MLYIHFGSLDDEIKDVDAVFNLFYTPEWLDDPFVREILKDVDHCVVEPYGRLQHEFLGSFSVDGLSGGTKSLLLAYFLNGDDASIIDASNCGDNCAKWLLKISKMKDITVTLCNIMAFPLDEDFECVILNNSERVTDVHDYSRIAVYYLFGAGKEQS